MENVEFEAYRGLGQAGAVFSMFLPDIIEHYPELKIVTADMSYIAKLDRFKALYPDKFINVGIAEQNMLGVCAGLSSEGYKCVALAQATFISMRCFEQVRQYMSYMKYPIILIGLAGGFQLQFMGNTHYAIEDIALMRSIPGIVIMSPADAIEAVKCFDEALKLNSPVYIRFTGDASNCVYTQNFNYSFRQSILLKDGNDICIFATGSMVESALKAANILEKEEQLSVSVIDMHNINPLDVDLIRKSKKCKLLVSIEEHHIIGGLGSAISDYISGVGTFSPLLRLGVGENYSEIGDYDFLLKQHRLTPELIADDIVKKYKQL